MLAAMLVMIFAAWFYAIAVTLHRVRSIILEREAHTDWVRALATGAPAGKAGRVGTEASR